MAGDPSDSGSFDDTLPASGSSPAQGPERIGRYRLERVLGRGGMGVVHAARDPDLDRVVALKVMHESRGQARLVREAQAMARLRHPNVLTVHDVGVSDDRVYITMELVEGTTLRAWQTAAPRTWREVVTMYIAAGRGLVAAHDAGIVHRDFNPGNVLVGKDGSIRVADFGLARALELPDEERPAGPTSTSNVGGDALTTVGTVVGTPAYMAPEQHEGDPVGPLADQFAFAAAMWEALAGARPFVGASIEELALAKREARLGPTPRHAPGWLVAHLRRALRPDPGDRHASMADLVRALEHGLGRRRRVLAIAAAGAAVVGVAAVALVVARSPAGPGCKVAGADVAATWNDGARARIVAAFTASDRPHAAATLTRVLAGLDRAAGALSSARIAACEAERERTKPSAEALERRMACLDRRRNDLRAIVTLLGAGPDADVIDNAYEGVVGLEDPAGCAAAGQSQAPQPAPTIRAQVDDARARLAETEALLEAGKMEPAAAVIDDHVARARELGFTPLLAETLLLRARILADKGDAAAGIEAFQEAAAASAAARDDHLIAAALVEQLALLEDEGGKPADALQWMVAAEAAVARTGDPRLREDFLVARGNTYRNLGRYAESKTDLETALASVEARTGKESYETGLVVSSLANVLSDEGEMDEALALDRRVEAIYQKTLGPDHPKFAQLLNNIGLRLDAAGKYDEARAAHERSLSIKERTMGPEHPSVAVSLNNLGLVAHHQGRSDDSLAYHRRALAVREKALGPEHPLTASTLTNLGTVLHQRGSYDEALDVHRRALAIREKVLGPDHPSTAWTLAAMAAVLGDFGRLDEALAASKRALAIREEALGVHRLTAKSYANLANVHAAMGHQDEACATNARGLAIMEQVVESDHPDLVLYLVGEADCLRMRGKAREGMPLVERAVAIGEKNDVGDETALARAHSVLAYLLWETGGDRARALQLARDAHARLAGDPYYRADNAELARWLKARGVSVASP